MSSSNKRKGREMQNTVARIIAEHFNLKILGKSNNKLYSTDISKADLEVAVMSSTGADIKPISDRSKKILKFDFIEIKHWKKFYHQVSVSVISVCNNLFNKYNNPLFIFKGNRTDIFCAMLLPCTRFSEIEHSTVRLNNGKMIIISRLHDALKVIGDAQD